MAAMVYLLCAATALACAVLLLRGYARNRVRFLLWSGLCFALLTLDNVFLFVDMIILPDAALILWRLPIALVAVGVLLYGLIWEAQ